MNIYTTAAIVVILFFILRVRERMAKIDNHLLGGILEEVPYEKLYKEWNDLSWNGKDPYRIISLAASMIHAKNMDECEASQHLASSFYSQVKYLTMKGKIPTAIAFWLESKSFAKQAQKYKN